MDSVNEIQRMWEEWKDVPFPPEYAGKDVGGICVTSVDTFAAGCIDTFVSRKGRLDKRRISVLEECKNDLEVVVNSLDGKARSYFNDLLILANRVLQSVGR